MLYRIYIIYIVFLMPSCKPLQHLGTSTLDCPKVYDSLYKNWVFNEVTTMPEYPGGKQKMMEYLFRHLNYPNQRDFQGSVLVRFIVDENGSIHNVGIITQKSDLNIKKENITEIEKHVILLVSNMPKWYAGKCGAKNVASYYFLPLRF